MSPFARRITPLGEVHEKTVSPWNNGWLWAQECTAHCVLRPVNSTLLGGRHSYFLACAFFLTGAGFFAGTFLGALVADGGLTDLTGVAVDAAGAVGDSPIQNCSSARSSPLR